MNHANRYQTAYMQDYDFEKVMVHYRQKLLFERLDKYKPQIIIEIGCGMDSLCQRYFDLGNRFQKWITIEPADGFVTYCNTINVPGFYVIHDYFENSLFKINEISASAPDFIICSSLLHEIVKPENILLSMRKLMSINTVSHINVPNAFSMHRQLAKAMNLINDVKNFSARNKHLMQQRVYDLSELSSSVEKAGMQLIAWGGYFIKPFTHQQMQAIRPTINSDVMDGMYELGKSYPELASEIFVEARRAA